MPSRDLEPRRRRRSYDRDARDSPRTSIKPDKFDSLRSARSARSKVSSTSSTKDRDRSRDRARSGRSTPRAPPSSDSSTGVDDNDDDNNDAHAPRRKKVTVLVPEMDRRRASADEPAPEPRQNIPYPSFSKAHSREAVRSRESVHSNPLTPQHTDVGSTDKSASPRVRNKRDTAGATAPPSPPSTTFGPDLRRAASGSSVRRAAQRPVVDTGSGLKVSDDDAAHLRKKSFTASSSSLRHAEEGVHRHQTSPTSKSSANRPESPRIRSKKSADSTTYTKSSRTSSRGTVRASQSSGSKLRSATGSDTTYTAGDYRDARKLSTVGSQGSSPPSDRTPSAPRTPQNAAGYSSYSDPKHIRGHGIEVLYSDESGSDNDGTAEPMAPPPPPPPPNVTPGKLPQVDYLLENGGLSYKISKVFASAANPPPTQAYSQYASPQVVQSSRSDHVHATFGPYSKLLDNFGQVLAKNGSLAVATGYKSVARRLLDKLEETFARDVSSEKCPCVMCKNAPESFDDDDRKGANWTDVLELVSQQRQPPTWPPFHLEPSASGLGISHLAHEAPMQKLDIDVPEEYREHYIRQSKKTKQSVQKWLAGQPEDTDVGAPSEIDDETMSFAMLTYLEPEQRRVFTALMRGLSKLPESRTPTPAPTEPKPDFLPKMAIALQRLYRLQKKPRDPEVAMYLVKNPWMHPALMTLCSISQTEWDVILSGRFDSLLSAGTEDAAAAGRAPSRGPNATPLSRTGTPGGVPLSRGPTPFRNGTPGPPGSLAANPVLYDEETEIAVLAEIEREIYLGMEALEDAFEALHVKAEGVRRALRERNAGLSMLAQSRRGSQVEVRMGTPAPPPGNWGGNSFHEPSLDSETDDGMGDIKSELAPDDSASNVGFREHGRRRERNRRREKEATRRRTPAVLEEADEEDDRRRRRR